MSKLNIDEEMALQMSGEKRLSAHHALRDFDGTLIAVSHDRDFLDGLVTKVYEFGDGRVREHLCGINEFLEKKKAEQLS